MDGDDDQLMYIPDEIDTSGLLSKCASGDERFHWLAHIYQLRTSTPDFFSKEIHDFTFHSLHLSR